MKNIYITVILDIPEISYFFLLPSPRNISKKYKIIITRFYQNYKTFVSNIFWYL